MKTLQQALLISGFFITLHCAGQDSLEFIPSRNLDLSENKTVVLVFPAAIASVDRGSAQVLARKAAGASNVLQIRAARAGFAPTNLNVITSDGALYPFDLRYNPSPLHLAFRISPVSGPGPIPVARLDHPSPGPVRLKEGAGMVHGKPGRVSGISDQRDRMRARLLGIYIRDEVLYFQMELSNQSPVPFDPVAPAFLVRDRRRPKRTAIQDGQVELLGIYGLSPVVRSGIRDTLVCALGKFTVTRDRYLSITFLESGGGRGLEMRVPGRKILNCEPLEGSPPGHRMD
ncbi:MAG TPA: DUF4138 domain-containing protein [Chitinophagaceae bacterium]|nr:DUF4138 domain-containing protein [Chitinophagaceae bacterium]